jgi:hypothetical protein
VILVWVQFQTERGFKQVPRGVFVTLTVKDGAHKLDKSIRAMLRSRVLVGVPDTKADRKDGGPMNNASLAYLHNTGSPTQNIPARPFMEPGIEAVRAGIEQRLKAVGQAALAGNENRVRDGLEAIGLLAAGSIKNVINEGNFEPLKPGTLRARRKRGHTSEKPLVEFGEMRNSISYVVEGGK